MEIVVFNEKDRAHYNDFLLSSEYKDILQSWEWGEIKSKFGWQAQRLGFLKNSELKGVTQVLQKKSFGFSLFYIPRGPVINWGDPGLVKDLAGSLKNFFLNKINQDKTLFIRLEPPIQEDEELSAIFGEHGFKKYFKTVQPPSTLLIDLTPSQEEIFKKLRRTARNLIHRSKKEGMTVEVLNSQEITRDDLKAFYNLYRLTGKRFSFPLRPLRQFTFLLEEMKNSGGTRMYIAKIRGLTLAYGLVLVLGDRGFYIWGGTARHQEYSKFLNYGYIWGMLTDLKRIGVRTFDFWGLGPEDDKNHPWFGFTLFKKAFGGQRFDYIGAFDLPLSKFYPFFKLADKIITPKYRATS